MIHLSSYHSNGLPTVVWSNKVNLIGEKVYKPKIHFCEHCNKPILIYGRLIPCKHVFCYTCATLCLTQQSNKSNSAASLSPIIPGPIEPALTTNHLPNPSSPMQEDSPTNTSSQSHLVVGKGCHRCNGKALRVERNSLNSIFVCQIETCRRTYLSARDLQAHVTHRHSKGKSNQNAGTSTGSLAAISASPYISSSSLMHLNNNHSQSSSNRQSFNNNSAHANHSSNDSTNQQHRQRHGDRDHMNYRHHRDRDRHRDTFHRERERERDNKEYHRQSLQRAAQWAEASAQMLEKGLTR